MKLKYKKFMLLVTICIIGAKMVTYSADNQTRAVEIQQNKSKVNSLKVNQDKEIHEESALIEANKADTIINGDTFDVIDDMLEKNAYEEINTLIKAYYEAKLSNKSRDFEPLVNSTEYINIKDNGRRTKYIESYQNINCYTKKGLEDNSFIVYVYHETKFKDIKTVAPGLDRFFVKLNDDHKPYIFLGDMDQSDSRFINDTDNSEAVLDLVAKVNKIYEKAVEKDSKLYEFKLKLEEPVG